MRTKAQVYDRGMMGKGTAKLTVDIVVFIAPQQVVIPNEMDQAVDIILLQVEPVVFTKHHELEAAIDPNTRIISLKSGLVSNFWQQQIVSFSIFPPSSFLSPFPFFFIYFSVPVLSVSFQSGDVQAPVETKAVGCSRTVRPVKNTESSNERDLIVCKRDSISLLLLGF